MSDPSSVILVFAAAGVMGMLAIIVLGSIRD